MLTIGVSGLTGMIGRNLILESRRSPQASAQWRWVAFVRATSDTDFLRQQGVELRELDYGHPESLAGKVEDVEVFLHLAGLTKTSRPLEFYAANTQVTDTLLAGLRRYGRRLRHFLFSSSLSASGPSRSAEHFKCEDEPCTPISEYGRSKLQAEQLIRSSGLPWTVLRFPAIFGPYDRDGLLLLRLARRGWTTSFGAGEDCFSYLFAQDAARLFFRMLLNERLIEGLYNVCYDEPSCAGEFFIRVRRELGLPPKLHRLRFPLWCGRLAGSFLAAWKCRHGRDSIVNADKIGELLAKYWVASNRKIRDALELPSIQEEGALAETVRWFQARGLL
jgi:nucleoside-diphosphate-sugar epimerase